VTLVKDYKVEVVYIVILVLFTNRQMLDRRDQNVAVFILLRAGSALDVEVVSQAGFELLYRLDCQGVPVGSFSVETITPAFPGDGKVGNVPSTFTEVFLN
jgi:hypothetical protein